MCQRARWEEGGCCHAPCMGPPPPGKDLPSGLRSSGCQTPAWSPRESPHRSRFCLARVRPRQANKKNKEREREGPEPPGLAEPLTGGNPCSLGNCHATRLKQRKGKGKRKGNSYR